jgi:hypothetical protein
MRKRVILITWLRSHMELGRFDPGLELSYLRYRCARDSLTQGFC